MNIDRQLTITQIREGMVYIVTDEKLARSVKTNPYIDLENNKRIKDNKTRGTRPYLIVARSRQKNILQAIPITTYKGNNEYDGENYYILTEESDKYYRISCIKISEVRAINVEQVRKNTGFIGIVEDETLKLIRSIIQHNVFGEFEDHIEYDNNLENILSYVEKNNLKLLYSDNIYDATNCACTKSDTETDIITKTDEEKCKKLQEQRELKKEEKLQKVSSNPSLSVPINIPPIKQQPLSNIEKFNLRMEKAEEHRKKKEEQYKEKVAADMKNGLSIADMARKYRLPADTIYSIKKSVLEEQSKQKEEEAKKLRLKAAEQIEDMANTDKRLTINAQGKIVRKHTKRRIASLSVEEKSELQGMVKAIIAKACDLTYTQVADKFGISESGLKRCIKNPDYMYTVKR